MLTVVQIAKFTQKLDAIILLKNLNLIIGKGAIYL